MVPVVCMSRNASSLREHTSSCVESLFWCAEKNQDFPIESSDRGDGCGRTQDSVCYGRGSGISQTRQLLIPNPDGVWTLPAPQILVLPARPAPRRERALATHVEVTQEKYAQETGQCLGVTPRTMEGRRFVLVFWFWLGGVRIEIKARRDMDNWHMWLTCWPKMWHSGRREKLQVFWMWKEQKPKPQRRDQAQEYEFKLSIHKHETQHKHNKKRLLFNQGFRIGAGFPAVQHLFLNRYFPQQNLWLCYVRKWLLT